jgi:asparagine synthase (glutamine-hydrolysing)
MSPGPAHRTVPRPGAVEILANLLLGPDDRSPPFPEPEGVGVDAALEQAVLAGLRRPPCLVSFSGGRDSSAVLAVAVRAARRHGLPDPVPVIMRFRHAPESDETAWQELVLSHLGLAKPTVVELHYELEVLGGIATRVLREGGVRWPSNAYMHVPLLEPARGGALLTGVGGDELLQSRGAPHLLAFHRRERPRPRHAVSLAAALSPRRLREAMWRWRRAPAYPWLTAAGQALVRRELARDTVSWPQRWDHAVRHWHGSRAFSSVAGSIARIAEGRDVLTVNPLIQPPVLAELALRGGPTGFRSRDAAMRELFGDLLPSEVLTRRGKAGFTEPFWGPRAAAFAAEWDGSGVDARHVDVEAVRSEWSSERPDFRTSLLLQAAWLHADGQASVPSS